MRLADNENRRRALTDLDASLLIEAAAGTGKTSLMAGRVAMHLVNGCEPRNVAAITFTELAASELAMRIRGYVQELLADQIPDALKFAIPSGLTPDQKASLELAAARLDELTTSTIHGFCQSVIRSYAIEADLDPGSRVMDGPTADAMFETSFSEWLVGRLSVEVARPEDPIAVLSKDDPLRFERDLKDLALLKREHTTAKTIPMRADLRPDIDFCHAVDEFARWFAGTDGRERKTAAIVADLQTLALFYSDCFAQTPTFEQLWHFARPPRVATMRKWSLDLAQYQCKSAWKSAYGVDDGERLNAEAERLFSAIETEYRELLGHVANGLVGPLSSVLDEVLTIYSRRKRDAAVLDFNDLIYRALDLVSRHETVRQALGRRFRHVLVDEFQDTDPIQAAFIFLLGAGERPAQWNEARLRPGSLFLVGDPKQAIYRFRGADIGAYKLARSAMESQQRDSVLQVTANFRSQKTILDHVNACFAPVLSGADQPGYVELSHTIDECDDKLPSIAKVTIDLHPDSKPGEQRDAEAESVAGLCAKLIGAVEIRRPDGTRSLLKPSDIALLAPTRTDLWRYERALEGKRLTVASQAGKTLFLRQETQDVLALLRVLADPLDTLAFGALMRGPLVGLSDEQLLDITDKLRRSRADESQPTTFTVMSSPDEIVDPVAKEVLHSLQKLRRRAAVTTPLILLAEAAELLRIRVTLAARYRNRSARALANLDALIEMARPYGVAGLRSFVRNLQRDWEANAPRAEGRTDASEDAIELVTIHSSKGLEWPVVIPVNTATQFRSPPQFLHRQSDDTLHWMLGGVAPIDLEQTRAEEAHNEARERERMWYVACTRARDLLILPHLTSAPRRSWSRIMDLGHSRLPELSLDGIAERPLASPTVVKNMQSPTEFADEAIRISQATPDLKWKRPSDGDPDRPDVLETAPSESESLDDASILVSGSRVRGIILHKIMEELLTGELLEEEPTIVARAGDLLAELTGGAEEPIDVRVDPKEAALTALRTLRLPDVISLRPQLIPETAVWASADEDHLIAGRADALAIDGSRIFAVLDWKSDVAPTTRDRANHRSQLTDYLAATGAERGAIIYMTLGEVFWIHAV